MVDRSDETAIDDRDIQGEFNDNDLYNDDTFGAGAVGKKYVIFKAV